jgi:hypothetical protein
MKLHFKLKIIQNINFNATGIKITESCVLLFFSSRKAFATQNERALLWIQ